MYLSILIFFIVAFFISVMIVGFSLLINTFIENKDKSLSYECGFDTYKHAHDPFDVKFYLVSILFVLFDVETIFIFPWVIVFRKLNYIGIYGMALFLVLLVIGFMYEWRSGALNWK
ncbi:NADH-quinone oxidoreductase subunit A [Candidatus Legionella polyplacis]|uniref:NADH-quinone oxidoreductase subunit A n=1 Tax=Candidatus Legionella polyplacis TaxID=2005262 RepID=UPI000C1EBC17|nr:NADH-quinone oxidoreductase subunit A [Candidatus Legionella polyplacis]ATW01808.1 NADH-quinone oxidoreductase subunit A [Candidatus Legionella polyplacis]